jgi:hypothetical protein
MLGVFSLPFCQVIGDTVTDTGTNRLRLRLSVLNAYGEVLMVIYCLRDSTRCNERAVMPWLLKTTLVLFSGAGVTVTVKMLKR